MDNILEAFKEATHFHCGDEETHPHFVKIDKTGTWYRLLSDNQWFQYGEQVDAEQLTLIK